MRENVHMPFSFTHIPIQGKRKICPNVSALIRRNIMKESSKGILVKVIYAVVAVAMIALDQITKSWIYVNLRGHENIIWIKDVFELQYVENTGAAFSSFSGKQTFLLILTSIILLLAIVEFIRIPDGKRYGWLRFAFTMLISGAVGNMIDRVKQGFVVDFFYFVPINFPRFNVADVFITCSAVLLGVLLLFVYKDEETAFLFNFKKK